MSKKNKIEILALIDRSGSMQTIMPEAVGAFNAFIEEQRELSLDDKVKVTLASFDNNYEVVFDRVPLDEVRELTVEDVQPRGLTALNDSIAELINNSKYPERDTILLIQTDGYENASKEYSTTAIKELVDAKKDSGWDVNFIGAGLSDASVNLMASAMGINKSFAVEASASGMADFKAHLSAETTLYRSSKL